MGKRQDSAEEDWQMQERQDQAEREYLDSCSIYQKEMEQI